MHHRHKPFITSLLAIAGFALAVQSPPNIAAPRQKTNQINPSKVSPALKMAYFEALAKESNPAYVFDRKSRCAENQANAFQACFKKNGVHFSHGKSTFSLRVKSYGREGQIYQIQETLPEVRHHQVQYRYGSFTEWYRNLKLGLEQGFTLKAPPKGKGQITLTLQSNVKPEKIGKNAYRLGTLVYKDLLVVDANGKSLPAQITAEGTNLNILVDDQNAAYPIMIDPWFQRAKLTPDDGAIDDKFGNTLAIYDNTALIGSPYADVNGNKDQGAVYVFTQNGEAWALQTKLVAPDGASDDLFGVAVDLYSDTAVIGAKGTDPQGLLDRGSAYIFVRKDGAWSHQATVSGDDSFAFDKFGSSVAIFENTVIIGAENAPVNNNPAQGTAYVFVRKGETWSQQAKIQADDGASSDMFGSAVDLYKDTAIVGANLAQVGENRLRGAAYIFKRNGSSWAQEAKLTANDGAAFDRFGFSVSLFKDLALIGSPWHKIAPGNEKEDGEGAAYVFFRTNNTWSQKAKLTAADGNFGDQFGRSVKLYGHAAAIGAPEASINGAEQQGAAYLFARNTNGAWLQKSKLTAQDGTEFDEYGIAVAMSANKIIVGADEADFGVGASYITSRMPFYSVTDSTLYLSNIFMKEASGHIRDNPWRAILKLKGTNPIILEVIELEMQDKKETPNEKSVTYSLNERLLNIPEFYILDKDGKVQQTHWQGVLRLNSTNPIMLEALEAAPIK